MKISLDLNTKEEKMIKDYAKLKNVSVSKLIKDIVIEKIEDEVDLQAYNKAYLDFIRNPKTYSLDEVRKILA